MNPLRQPDCFLFFVNLVILVDATWFFLLLLPAETCCSWSLSSIPLPRRRRINNTKTLIMEVLDRFYSLFLQEAPFCCIRLGCITVDTGPEGPELGGYQVEIKIKATQKLRQKAVSKEHHDRTRKLDSELHGTQQDQRGPIESELNEYGHSGRVLAPVIGRSGGASSDSASFLDLVARETACKHSAFYSIGFSEAKALFRQKLARKWGHEIPRGWASLLLDRLRDFVVVPSSAGGNSSFELHSLSIEGHATLDRYHHFHGHSGMCAWLAS